MHDARTLAAAAAAAALALCLAAAPLQAQDPAVNTLSERERAEGWRLLFDGATTSGWRGYGRPDMPAGWEVVNGTLTRTGRAGDIITIEKFRNFDLTFDFMVPSGGNSGVFYRAVEGLEAIYYGAPEYQVLDDAVHPDGRSELTAAGSNFGLHPAPRGVVRPAGEWNSGRIVVRGNSVEHWLNGRRIIEYQLGSPDWAERVATSKFSQWPAYGKAGEGHIGLQDHGDRVSFRNIRIRVLP